MKHNQPPSAAEVAESLPQLLRLPAVLQATGLGRSTVYRMIAERTFPAPVKLAQRAVAWRQDDLRKWTIERPSTSRRSRSAPADLSQLAP